jgi:hypothetical protein
MKRPTRFIRVDLNGFFDAVGIQSQSGFIAVGFDHQAQRFAKILAAFVQRPAVGDGAGDFLDPPHKPASRFWFDNGVVTLPHTLIKALFPAVVKLNPPL